MTIAPIKNCDSIEQRSHAKSHSPIALILCAIILTVCGGCATSQNQWKANGYKVGPNYCRPSASLEVEWIDVQHDPRLSIAEPDLHHWWHALNDPTLNALIETSLQQNLTLRQAYTRIQQAESIRAIAVGNLFPQVQQANGDYQRIQTSQNVAVPSPVRNFDQFNLGLGAAWELDVWGRFRRSVAVADANLDASIASYDDVAVILLANVATTYVQIRAIQERLRITEAIIESQTGSRSIAEAQFKAKKTNKLDVIQAENNIDITEAAIPALEAQLRIANDRLCVLLGFPPRDFVAELPPAPIPTASRDIQVGIPADLLRRRPDIRRSERLMRAQSERIGIAEADLYPRISLIGSFEWQAEDIDDLFDSQSVFGLISPGFSWNILNYGRISNSIELERQKFCEAVLQYQESVLIAQQEVEDALVGFLKAQEQVEKLSEAVGNVNEAEEIAVTLYRTGATDFNRVFLIQSIQFSQQDQLVVARANETLNLIKVYRALGGGWQTRCYGYDASSAPLMVEEGFVVDGPAEVLQMDSNESDDQESSDKESSSNEEGESDDARESAGDDESKSTAESDQDVSPLNRLKQLLEDGGESKEPAKTLEELLEDNQ